MGFWKKHSYQVVRLFVIQIGIAIFGLVLSFAVQTAFRNRSDWLPLLMVSIFSVLFYLFLLYSVAWELGGKDRLSRDALHLPPRGETGFILALLAGLPNIVFDLFTLTGGIIFRFGSHRVGSWFVCIGYLPSIFIQSMYQGIVKYFLSVSGLTETGSTSFYLVAALLFILATIPAILVTGFGYWMGMHEKRIIPARRANPDGKNF